MHEPKTPDVCICIVTYRRTHLLSQLLASLSYVDSELLALRVVVVDNDPHESAREVVQQTSESVAFPVSYVVEERPGIPSARNRALEAWGGGDFVVFIDDDEMPSESWLQELVMAQRAYNADVVTGPALPKFEQGVPDWVIEGGFFERERHPTGTPLPAARTSNVLIRGEVLERCGIRFDETYGMNGGDDSDFFMRLKKQGCSIVWADQAVVEDLVPRSRATAPWLLRRSLRVGSSYSVAEGKIYGSHRLKALRLLKGLAHVCRGLAVTVFGVIKLHRVTVVEGGRSVMLGLGMIGGTTGWLYQEYRR